MNTQEAIKILKQHNAWRRGKPTPQLDPRLIGDAIDMSCRILEEYLDLQKQTESEDKTVEETNKHLESEVTELREILIDVVDALESDLICTEDSPVEKLRDIPKEAGTIRSELQIILAAREEEIRQLRNVIWREFEEEDANRIINECERSF